MLFEEHIFPFFIMHPVFILLANTKFENIQSAFILPSYCKEL